MLYRCTVLFGVMCVLLACSSDGPGPQPCLENEDCPQGQWCRPPLEGETAGLCMSDPYDRDGDSIRDDRDNCLDTPNTQQENHDDDAFGDACDDDDDNDRLPDAEEEDGLSDPHDPDTDDDEVCDGPGSPDEEVCEAGPDNCPATPNPEQEDLDGDDIGDECDQDIDGDGLDNEEDNCPYISNPVQEDLDDDGEGDACEDDWDGDEVINDEDNCPDTPNPDQENADGDDLGDLCDADIDDDGFDNEIDNCPYHPNPGQEDLDGDGEGDACEDDWDGDGVCNGEDPVTGICEVGPDNCPYTPNSEQEDLDEDGQGDACDPDVDGDEVINEEDNCPRLFNFEQEDLDEDGEGDACDDDVDGDGVINVEDNCATLENPEQIDLDGDGLGDVCDDDDDGDEVIDEIDLCPGIPDPEQADTDGDELGDLCDDAISGECVPDEEPPPEGEEPVCEPCEETVCEEEEGPGPLLECRPDGMGFQPRTYCHPPFVCRDGACETFCTPGEQRCLSDSSVGVCATDGGSFEPRDCPDGLGCNPATHHCEAICSPGERGCSGTRVVECNADGFGWRFVENCAPDACVDGACPPSTSQAFFYNNLACSGRTFTATLTIGGTTIRSTSGSCSTCNTIPAGRSIPIEVTWSCGGTNRIRGTVNIDAGRDYAFLLIIDGGSVALATVRLDASESCASHRRDLCS